MKKEMKESITKSLIEKMDKKLSERDNLPDGGAIHKTCKCASREEDLAKDGMERMFHATVRGIVDEYKDEAIKQITHQLINGCNGWVVEEKNKEDFGECHGGVCTLKKKSSAETTFENGIEMVFKECLDLYKRKNHDYSNRGESAFDKAYKKMGAKSLWLRLNDKFTRFESLLFADDEAQVKDEKIEDTLLDLINYAAMGLAKLKGYN